jgi:phospholipid/cholesterol/gamma-HCH transport system ATP-binding protein
MSAPLIELKGVSKSFGNTVVLDRVNLEIYESDAVAIIGPSGTGKSTILRIIAGLLAPDEGEIYIRGRQRVGLIDDAEGQMAIGMVFQQAALFDSLTVEENVVYTISALQIAAAANSGLST